LRIEKGKKKKKEIFSVQFRLLTGLANALAPSNSRIEMSLNWAKEKKTTTKKKGLCFGVDGGSYRRIKKSNWTRLHWKNNSLFLSLSLVVVIVAVVSFSVSFQRREEEGLICLEIRLTSRSFFHVGRLARVGVAAAASATLS
jgi:hypothetical protein